MHRVVGAVTVTPAESFVSPLSESSPSPRKALKKKKSVSPHDSQFIQANVRQPFQVTLDSAFDRLKMNSSRPSARYHSRSRSWRKQVDWLAQTTLYPSLPGSDSWLSKKKQKNTELVPARLGAVTLHFRCCRNILDLVDRSSTNILDHCWACHASLTLFDCVTCAICSRSMYATSQRHDL